jgi:hypothetical protein
MSHRTFVALFALAVVAPAFAGHRRRQGLDHLRDGPRSGMRSC